MSSFKLELNREGVGELLRCPEMAALIDSLAVQVEQSSGEGYTHELAYGTKDGRVRAYVMPQTDKASQENYEENTILKAVGGAND